MDVRFDSEFDKHFNYRLSRPQKIKVFDAIAIFTLDPFNEDLRNHSLKGQWAGYRSISVGGDLRAHYRELDLGLVLFVAVGSHDQLYK